jgi:hypothetical protein
MIRLILFVSISSIAICTTSLAAPIYYGTRAAFNAANPGLPVEGFENLDGTGSTITFNGPLNAASNIPGVASPGQILAGISFIDNPAGINNPGMFLAAPNQSTNPTTALGSNIPHGDSLDILLSPGVFAVAFDIYQNIGGGGQAVGALNYDVSIFGTSGLLGVTTISVNPNSSGFYGVSSTEAITRVNVLGTSGAIFEVIDDVAFGGASQVVPEPLSLSIWSVLGAGGIVVWRRKRKQNRK